MRDPRDELRSLEEEGLRRELRPLATPQGTAIELENRESFLNFSSNDYLGRTNSALWKQWFQESIEIHGAGSGASRLVCGTLAPHVSLETRLADLKRTEAALTFSSGYATATGVLPALCAKGDVIILDKLSHACLIDGARLSGATMRIFPHNDVAKLKSHLQWARSQVGPEGRILVATESIFSMDGDACPLEDVIKAKEKAGALLLLDEAHAFGVLGPEGRGLAAACGVEDRVDLHMGTFSKAVGLSGGYVCGSREMMDLLIHRARSFIYSTAPSPALSATIEKALDWITGPEGEAARGTLWARVREIEPEASSPIVPRILGSNEAALAAAEYLRKSGILVPAIRYPTVPRGTARLRITLSAGHTREQVLELKNALAGLDLTR